MDPEPVVSGAGMARVQKRRRAVTEHGEPAGAQLEFADMLSRMMNAPEDAWKSMDVIDARDFELESEEMDKTTPTCVDSAKKEARVNPAEFEGAMGTCMGKDGFGKLPKWKQGGSTAF